MEFRTEGQLMRIIVHRRQMRLDQPGEVCQRIYTQTAILDAILGRENDAAKLLQLRCELRWWYGLFFFLFFALIFRRLAFVVVLFVVLEGALYETS